MHSNIIVRQKVSAPVDEVWEAITDKAQMKEWFFDIPDFELEPHSEFNFFEPGDEKKHHHHGEILEVIPKQKLKYSWSYPEVSKEKTIVKWELHPVEGGTEVTLKHKGLENFEHLGSNFSKESFEEGWNTLVGKSLKEHLEK